MLESVGRCAKKMKIGIPTVDVSLRCPEANEDGSRAAEMRDGMKRRECRTETGGCCRRVRVRPGTSRAESSGEKESWLGTCVQGISEAIGRDVDSEVGDLRLGKNMRKIGCERWAVRRRVACERREG